MVNLVHKVKADLMLQAMHTGLLLHLATNRPSFHPLGKNVSLTQHIVVSVVHRSIIEVILRMLAHLGVDRGLVKIHHVVNALRDTATKRVLL